MSVYAIYFFQSYTIKPYTQIETEDCERTKLIRLIKGVKKIEAAGPGADTWSLQVVYLHKHCQSLRSTTFQAIHFYV